MDEALLEVFKSGTMSSPRLNLSDADQLSGVETLDDTTGPEIWDRTRKMKSSDKLKKERKKTQTQSEGWGDVHQNKEKSVGWVN